VGRDGCGSGDSKVTIQNLGFYAYAMCIIKEVGKIKLFCSSEPHIKKTATQKVEIMTT
jgi:hypothetical protein